MKQLCMCPNIPFTYRNNVALVMQNVPDGVPKDPQAKDLKRHITRAILHFTNLFEGLRRVCPWIMKVTPATLV